MDLPGRPPAPHGLPEPRRDEEHIGARDLADWPTAAGRWLVLLVTVAATRLARLVGWGRDNLALVVTALVGGALVLVLDLLAAKVYDAVLDQEGLETLDRPVLDAMVALRTPGADVAVGAFTDLGGIVGMSALAVVLTVVLAVVRRSWTPVLLMAVAAAGSVLMTVVGKDLIGRSRPPVTLAVPPLESSPSFPSGHTLNATVLIGMLAYLALLGSARVWLRWLVVVTSVLFVLAMGLSRVYLGHHWLTDVVAGWLLGLGWLGTVVTAHRIRATLRRSDQPPATAARPASSRATGTRKGEHDT